MKNFELKAKSEEFMIEYMKPIYLPNIRRQRFFIYLLVAIFLLFSTFLPFSLYLISLQLAGICVLMAVYQFWEWSRLTSYEEFSIGDGCISYKFRGQEMRLAFSDISVSFLYYSSLDKMKGSATLCLRLKNGKTYRFCGIQQVDSLLKIISDYR